MKSLAERQADRAQRRADEAEARSVTGVDTGEDGKPKGKGKGVTRLKVEGGEGDPGAGSPGSGNGGGNPFGS